MKLANLAGAMALLLMQGCAPPTEIGFLSPDGLSSEFSPHVDVAMVNALSIEQLTISLHEARRANIRLLVDLGPIMRQPAPASEVKGSYLGSDGNERQKQLAPAPRNKLWAKAGHADGMRRLQAYLPLLSAYTDVVDSVFLIDEPYLNGVSRQAYAALADDVRQTLDGAGLQHVKIGVIFSSALFNADFAQLIQRHAAAYVEAIDNEYLRIGDQPASPAEQAWRENIAQHRLTTYDLAGNIYTGGGIPEGVDWVSFNFYVSSLLLDQTHEESRTQRYRPRDVLPGQPVAGKRSQPAQGLDRRPNFCSVQRHGRCLRGGKGPGLRDLDRQFQRPSGSALAV